MSSVKNQLFGSFSGNIPAVITLVVLLLAGGAPAHKKMAKKLNTLELAVSHHRLCSFLNRFSRAIGTPCHFPNEFIVLQTISRRTA
jgi:hypothetical protein